MIYILALVLFFGLFLVSAVTILSYLGESRAQEVAFDTLEELAAEAETSSAQELTVDSDIGEAGTSAMLPGYAALYVENPDLFVWVQIPDTELSYPVMYMPNDPEYYLCRDFDRSESVSGVPFLDGDCPEDGGNYLIYGHHMSGGTMFALLPSHAKQDYILI